MDEKKPLRRGRKAKKSTDKPEEKKQPKKRGRKPKGGKIKTKFCFARGVKKLLFL